MSSAPGAGRLPRIGITTSSAGPSTPAAQRCAAAIEAAGGAVVWITPGDIRAVEDAAAVLAALDGLLLSGGKDIPPSMYGETLIPDVGVEPDADRYEVEVPLARAALAARLPVLGICGGLQAINVAAGGSLYQDLSLIDVSPAAHKIPGTMVAHPVRVMPHGRLANLMAQTAVEVNSSHHQAVKAAGAGVVVTAQAPDGVVEAIEAPALRFVIGVQWHPERMVETDPRQRRLFDALIHAAQQRE